MKKVLIGLVIFALICAGAFGVHRIITKSSGKKNAELVYVDTVTNIMGTNSVGNNRYMGIVEAQETKGIEKDNDKKIKEVFVQVEDVVKEGDKLFEYDTEEMRLTLSKMELELTSINTQISTTYEQINGLVEERETVPDEKKMEYTSMIQNYQAQINQLNYDASAKQLEIDRQAAAMKNAIVYSPMDGIIKDIKKDDSSNNANDMYDYGGYGGYGNSSNENYFISIMANGEYRVKGTADEFSVAAMTTGTPIIIRSRVDENITWKGTIGKIDKEHPNSGNNDDYYYGNSSEKASNYPFYVDLESVDGLILGQHVYIENDYGQGDQKSGTWLYEFYISREESGDYVYKEVDGKIQKVSVMLGTYDENLMSYEITAGLSDGDYIAFPEERITEGMKTTHVYEESFQYNSDSSDNFEDNQGINGDDSFDIIDDESYKFDNEGYFEDNDGGEGIDGEVLEEDLDDIGGSDLAEPTEESDIIGEPQGKNEPLDVIGG